MASATWTEAAEKKRVVEAECAAKKASSQAAQVTQATVQVSCSQPPPSDKMPPSSSESPCVNKPNTKEIGDMASGFDPMVETNW